MRTWIHELDRDTRTLIHTLERERSVCVEGLHFHAQIPLMTNLLKYDMKKPILWLVPSSRNIEDIEQAVAFWKKVLMNRTGEIQKIGVLPEYDRQPYHFIPTHSAIVRKRLQYWNLWRETPPTVSFMHPLTFLRRIPDPQFFHQSFFTLERGEEIPRDFFEDLIREYRYRRVDLVSQPGEIALRGFIIDIYPFTSRFPYRLQFLDELLESIRIFDPATQRSIQTVTSCLLTPCSEYPLTREALQKWTHKAGSVLPPSQWHEDFHEWMHELIERGEFPGYEDYLPWFGIPLTNWSELLHAFTFIVTEPDAIQKEIESLYEETVLRYQTVLEEGFPVPEPSELFKLPDVEELIEKAHVLFIEEKRSRASLSFTSEPIPSYEGHLKKLVDDIKRRHKRGWSALIIMDTPASAERIERYFFDMKEVSCSLIEPEKVFEENGLRTVVTWGPVPSGFECEEWRLLTITETDLFGVRPFKPDISHIPLERLQALDLSELHPGDLVVHREHGIGKFIGLGKIESYGGEVECVILEYQGGDRLYIPCDRLDVLKKYSGTSADRLPSLDKLGGKTWKARRRRIMKQVETIVQELVELYAKRKTTQGFAFPPDSELQELFEKQFPYELTPDQKKALEEIKRDMESPKPMDRLLCGDVGFGKTELALRAACKAVLGGKQVAVLTPTTVLAFQHYLTFSGRFADFPVRIGLLCRLVPPGEQKKILEDLRSGRIDIVIGTHRLLSKDVSFHDLGLLIIDEEQRFGVSHKEKIKQLKEHVDVLTMTATPIPRTLQMAFTGLLEMSTIRTPPRDRLSIMTYVVHFSPDVVRDAIRYELDRHGQVFFVHNNIETLFDLASLIQELVPGARIGVTHGRMSTRELEKIMLRFMNGEIDVLVTTTIIENGVDIPNANTLIVNNAHRFGLAQLYQLRGRVGRSSRRAYAYFLIPRKHDLSEQARKRLRALKEFSELGAGFRLAALDLEIRGAGELLGKKQHGFIHTLGLDTYLEILHEAIARLQKKTFKRIEPVEVLLPEHAMIPDVYMPSEKHRLYYYQKCVTASSLEQLTTLEKEIEDLFGPLPHEVRSLILQNKIRVLATQLGVRKLSAQQKGWSLEFATLDGSLYNLWMQTILHSGGIQFTSEKTIFIPSSVISTHASDLYSFLSQLSQTLQSINVSP